LFHGCIPQSNQFVVRPVLPPFFPLIAAYRNRQLVAADDKHGIDVEHKKSLKSSVTNLYFFAAALAGTKQNMDALWATSLEKERAELEEHQDEQYMQYAGKRMYECSMFHATHADRLSERVQEYRDSIRKSSQ
jgi:hypothetical protein